jgi:hypothetical protein
MQSKLSHYIEGASRASRWASGTKEVSCAARIALDASYVLRAD